jgi:hypothetical protein
LYNNIKDEGLEDDIVDSQQEELFDVLAISDFSRPDIPTTVKYTAPKLSKKQIQFIRDIGYASKISDIDSLKKWMWNS